MVTNEIGIYYKHWFRRESSRGTKPITRMAPKHMPWNCLYLFSVTLPQQTRVLLKAHTYNFSKALSFGNQNHFSGSLLRATQSGVHSMKDGLGLQSLASLPKAGTESALQSKL